MNYTKGDWKVKICPRHTEVWFKDLIIAICPYQTPFSPKMREANANLIAAAPLLYEALKEAQTWIARQNLELPDLLPIELKIQQALAKAEGGDIQ